MFKEVQNYLCHLREYLFGYLSKNFTVFFSRLTNGAFFCVHNININFVIKNCYCYFIVIK